MSKRVQARWIIAGNLLGQMAILITFSSYTLNIPDLIVKNAIISLCIFALLGVVLGCITGHFMHYMQTGHKRWNSEKFVLTVLTLGYIVLAVAITYTYIVEDFRFGLAATESNAYVVGMLSSLLVLAVRESRRKTTSS